MTVNRVCLGDGTGGFNNWLYDTAASKGHQPVALGLIDGDKNLEGGGAGGGGWGRSALPCCASRVPPRLARPSFLAKPPWLLSGLRALFTRRSSRLGARPMDARTPSPRKACN